MTSRFLICLLALVMLATGTFAGARAAYATALSLADGPATWRAAGTIEGVAVVSAGKPCKRGALAGACGADPGLPGETAGGGPLPGWVAFERSSPPMAGLSPTCLVGPPRFC